MSFREKKQQNIEIGSRLKQWRKDAHISQAEMAEELGVSDEHYRKLENGGAGLTVDRVLILYEKRQIDPTYLLTGKKVKEFDLEGFLSSCDKDERKAFFERCFDYVRKYIY